MARGIIYIMSTVVPGLIKIGKTGLENYESRMYTLERNGYFNVTGLKRRFAIAVEDYDEKEALLGDIFSKSRVEASELFALDIDLAIQLLTSFEGTQVYPKNEKERTFIDATKDRSVKADWKKIPDGIYYLSETVKGAGTITASMRVEKRVENSVFTVLAGSLCAPDRDVWVPEVRRNAPIRDGILQEDTVCNSPSTAAWIVLCRPTNGWRVWKSADGQPIDIFREKKLEH